MQISQYRKINNFSYILTKRYYSSEFIKTVPNINFLFYFIILRTVFII